MAGFARFPWTATSKLPLSVSTRSSRTEPSSLVRYLSAGNWSWMFFSSMSSILSEGIVLCNEQTTNFINKIKKKRSTLDLLLSVHTHCNCKRGHRIRSIYNNWPSCWIAEKSSAEILSAEYCLHTAEVSNG